jgi:hypothetical protein
LLNKSKFSYKKQDSWPKNVNALLLAIISSLIVVLYTLKTIGLLLLKNNSAKTLNLCKRELRVLQVIKALFDKTLLQESNISLNGLKEHILL